MAYRSAGAVAHTTTGSISLALPAGIIASDILILVLAGNISPPSGTTFTAGTGWTFLGDTVAGASVGGIYVAWAFGTATAPTLNLNFTSAVNGVILAFSGRVGRKPRFIASGPDNNGGSATNTISIQAFPGDDICVVVENFGGTVATGVGSATSVAVLNDAVNTSSGEVGYVNNVSLGPTTPFQFISDGHVEKFNFIIAMGKPGGTGQPKSGFLVTDPIFGTKDLDDVFITETALIDQYVGTNLFTWGNNQYGNLGNNNVTYYSSPIQVGSLTNWKNVSMFSSHGVAIKTDGTLWSWGFNAYGQLMNNNRTYYSSPIQIGSLTDWKQVGGGASHTLAVKTDGTLWACGYNNFGELGTGNRTYYSSPIQIGSLTDWKYVASGTSDHALAIKTDGTLWGWGMNHLGQIGNGSQGYYSSPIQVGSLTNWKTISLGLYHTMAIKTDGTLWGWGMNNFGQLGLNAAITTYYSSPVQVGSLTTWKQVSCGGYHTMAINEDGSMWACGYNLDGELGNNVSTYFSSPVQVGSLNSWKAVAAGGFHNVAIMNDGSLWTWGYNAKGQLGDGTVTARSRPLQVGLIASWRTIAAGAQTTLATTLT